MSDAPGGSAAIPDGNSSLSQIRSASPPPAGAPAANPSASATVPPLEGLGELKGSLPVLGDFGSTNLDRQEGTNRSFMSSPHTVRETTEANVEKAGGTTFVNQYIIIKQLGIGSYGTVRLCLNTEDNKLYAVKVIDKGVLKKKNNRLGKNRTNPLDNVMREIAIMKKISNPHVVNLVEVIDDPAGTELYMVMEYVECGPVCGRDGPSLQEAIAKEYFRQMCLGLDYLHFNGVMHRDLKPENLLRNADGVVKLADFGVSELFKDDGTDTLQRTAGTPAFLAPEVCGAGPYHGRAADVWAMGICLYNMIYAKVPFFAITVLEIYDSIKTKPLEFPDEPAVSEELKDLLMRILEKDPEKRFSLGDVMSHTWTTHGGSQKLARVEDAGEGIVEVSQAEVAGAVREDKLAAMIAPKSGTWTEKTFPAGTYLFRQGETGDAMFMINEGECEVLLTVEPEVADDDSDIFASSSDEDEEKEEAAPVEIAPQVLAVRGAGSIVGEMAIFGDGLRMADLRCRTAVKVLVITKEEVMATLRERPEAEQQLRNTIAKRKNETIVFETTEKMRYLDGDETARGRMSSTGRSNISRSLSMSKYTGGGEGGGGAEIAAQRRASEYVMPSQLSARDC